MRINPVYLIRETVLDSIRWTTFQVRGRFAAEVENDRLHLDKTVEWLELAAQNGNGGVASHYDPVRGRWLSPFPETTGYVIPTLFDYARFSGQSRFATLAIQLTDWLAGVQLPDGGCMRGVYDEARGFSEPIVFNTGQNLLGFIRTFDETGDQKYLESARKAGDFLVASTDDSGIWDKHLLRGLQHTINTRCAWALLQLDRRIPGARYAWVAEQNLKWVQKQQTENGWFRYGSSKPRVLPNTHFIAYTCRGLIESHRLTGDRSYLETARKTADRMRGILDDRAALYAFWNHNWENRGKHVRWTKGRYMCLAGNVQMSLIWMKLFEEYGDPAYRDSAFRILDQVKALQSVSSPEPGIRGGVKGSFPVFGGYSTFKYPNWAAKFLADALMLKIKLQESS